jgi:hypothetical protein
MNDNDHPATTVAALRDAFAAEFDRRRVRTCLQRLREAGHLPAGRQGRCGSAPVTAKQAALALLALALDTAGDAIRAAQEAQRVGDFRLQSFNHIQRGGPLGDMSTVSFVNFLAAEITQCRGVPADDWIIGNREATQRWPDRITFAGMPSAGVQRQTIVPGRLLARIAALFAQSPPPSAASAPGEALEPDTAA